MKPPSALLLLFFATVISCPTAAQTQPRQPNPEKAEQIVNQALEAVGGQRYLAVRTLVGRGQYTQFNDGVSGLPSTFIDYIAYPDKERTEFKSSGARVIQTNTGDTGWLFDGAARMIKVMKKEQVDEFKANLRVSVENLLRGGWRTDGAQLSYVGRREAGLAKRNEVVRLTYPDGFTVEYEFGAKDNLPAKVFYTKKRADGAETKEEDRFAQMLTVSGIVTPFVVDHFTEGKQTSRLNYQSVEYNTPIPDSLFAQPASIKSLK
jgi:outer membrane lipoprotein-sorting protein